MEIQVVDLYFLMLSLSLVVKTHSLHLNKTSKRAKKMMMKEKLEMKPVMVLQLFLLSEQAMLI